MGFFPLHNAGDGEGIRNGKEKALSRSVSAPQPALRALYGSRIRVETVTLLGLHVAGQVLELDPGAHASFP